MCMNNRSVCRVAGAVLLSVSMVKELNDVGALPHMEYSIPEFPVVMSNTIVSTAAASALVIPMVKK
jgi:hypothetical protein